MRFRFIRWFFHSLVRLLTDLRVEGLENVPPSGPYILASNHLSVADVAVGYGVLGGEHVTGWAADKYRRHPLFGPIVRLGRGVFIRRGQVDREAMDKAVDWLRRGNVFGLSPEGTRSRTGALLRGKTGPAYLAHLAKVPILPIGLTGTETTFAKLKRLQRPKLGLRVGPLFHLPPLDEANRNADLRRDADEIMCRIAALLPPEYRGEYADHPRLQALLQSETEAVPSGET